MESIPDALSKALNDQFDYAMGLRNGQIIYFGQARLQENREWVTLIGVNGLSHAGGDGGSIEMTGVSCAFPRGVDIRISDIVWVADTPNGS